MANEASTLLSPPEDVVMTSPPKDKLKVRTVRTPPTHEASTPMSCSSADVSYTNRSESCDSEVDSSFSTASSSVRAPLPSPARARLDRQYAKRLAISTAHSATPATVKTTPSPFMATPPDITRDFEDGNFFRPTPILKTTSDFPAPRHFFFPSTPHRESANSSFYSTASSGSSVKTPSSALSRRRRTPQKATEIGSSDRFIPSRATSNMKVNLWDSIGSNNTSSPRRKSSAGNNSAGSATDTTSNPYHMGHQHHHVASDDSNSASSVNPATGRPNDMASTTQQNLHNMLLRSELLGENISPFASTMGGGNGYRIHSSSPPLGDGGNRLRFQSPRQAYHDNIYSDALGPTAVVNSFSLTPFGSASSQRLMAAPQKRRRKIAKVPFKVLDAPALQDDFYLNLVDWSSQNVLAVGLGSCVYLWSACTSKVVKLVDLASSEDLVTSVSWAQRGTHLAVGTNKGEVQLWDTIKVKKVRTMDGHSARVGTLAWSGPILASGSRDRLIYLRDMRCNGQFTDRLTAHRQEVCGLRWSFDEPAFLASGGNDNQLHVVDSRNATQPIHRFSDHTAAVKAIAWSPHQHGLLASGGGTADRCIRFWNTLSGSALSSVDTGSQVCNLAWSQNCNEIVSTHGYSLNQIVVWRYPSLSKVVTLTGHTYRVLYLAVSPDGSTIVTGAGDETLRFWQVFPGPRSDAKNNAGGLLFPNTLGSVIR